MGIIPNILPGKKPPATVHSFVLLPIFERHLLRNFYIPAAWVRYEEMKDSQTCGERHSDNNITGDLWKLSTEMNGNSRDTHCSWEK